MALDATKIFLDFYINNIVTINAKLRDDNSRCINVVCTDHGKKVTLDKNRMSVFVRYKKPDNHFSFKEVDILEDGTLNVILDEDMLAVAGRAKVDIVIYSVSSLSIEDLGSADDFYNTENSKVISTMPFYINIYDSVVDDDDIESSDEFKTLAEGMLDVVTAAVNVNKLYGEMAKQTKAAENAAISADTASGSANTAADRANTASGSAETNAARAEAAAIRAENAADEAEPMIKRLTDAIDSGAVYQNEKGAPNGVAKLDENAKVSLDQLYVIKNSDDFEGKQGESEKYLVTWNGVIAIVDSNNVLINTELDEKIYPRLDKAEQDIIDHNIRLDNLNPVVLNPSIYSIALVEAADFNVLTIPTSGVFYPFPAQDDNFKYVEKTSLNADNVFEYSEEIMDLSKGQFINFNEHKTSGIKILSDKVSAIRVTFQCEIIGNDNTGGVTCTLCRYNSNTDMVEAIARSSADIHYVDNNDLYGSSSMIFMSDTIQVNKDDFIFCYMIRVLYDDEKSDFGLRTGNNATCYNYLTVETVC